MTHRLLALALLASPTLAADHVVVIGIDGLSPDGIRKARTPVIDQLRRDGASTLHARGVLPTVSSPNWASMIMGAGPEQHGVTSNDWQPDKFDIPPIARGPAGFFPTMFSQVRAQRPGAKIAVFHDWKGFGRLVEPAAADPIRHCDGPEETVKQAAQYILTEKPLLTFIHLDHVDHAGHKHEHGSPRYYAAVEQADLLIGRLLSALDEAGIRDRTAILISADHGGVGTRHGGATLAELEIPFIVYGAGIKRGHEIQTPVNIYDLAATVVHLLDVKPHPAWIAKPVLEALH